VNLSARGARPSGHATLLAVPVRDYQLTVEGELSDHLAASAFADMTLARAAGYTILVGPIRDQAELQGLLQRISDLGLTLLSATAVGAAEH
jgi:hypothetical protein